MTESYRVNPEDISVQEPVRIKLAQLSENIEFEKQVEKGANGFLFFGTNRISGQRIAVKFYPWSGDDAYHAEPQRLAELDSPNIARLHDAGFAGDEWAYFVTPYYERGDLDDEMDSIGPGNLRAIDVTRSILNGISHLHGEHLVHRDLKPQNIFVADDGSPIIGDFGSVKRIPEGQSTVPGSGHSILYRPPESISNGEYGRSGDLYQTGIVMYQMLGGRLPYDEAAWMSPRERSLYEAMSNAEDRSIFVDGVLRRRITRGQLVDPGTMPPWVGPRMRRLVARACRVDPTKRFQSCADFHGAIAAIRPTVSDWRIVDGHPTRFNGVTYRILGPDVDGLYRVQKRCASGWRNDNSNVGKDLGTIVSEIERRCRQ